MVALYADENIPNSLVVALITLGHDVLTVESDHRANQGIDDAEILTRATSLSRAVLTFNRWDFHRLHDTDQNHAGIISCTDDFDRPSLARRIDQAIRTSVNLAGKLVKVIRPN